MTGSGTQNDPYIVDNWTDYRQICTPTAYIEWDSQTSEKVIDFNQIQPDGFTSTIVFSRYTKFNGWKFKNLFMLHNTPLNFGTAGGILDGFILENFYWIPPTSLNESFLLYFNPNYNSISTLKNCVISGKIECQGKCKITNAYFCESSANIAVNSGNFTLTNYPVRNSDIVLDVSAPTVSFSPDTILNSRFSGEIQAENPVICGNSASGYNVFDFVSNQPAEYSGKGIMVYNSDKMAVTGSGNHKPCTTEQLKNPEYLKSIRFPIGVD